MANHEKHNQLNTQPTNNPANFNELLSELSSAEQAGVFQTSPDEANSLLAKATQVESVPAIFRMSRWVPFAAAAVLVLTVFSWSTMFSWKLEELREAKVRNNGQLMVAATNGDVGFFDCLSGPTSDLSDQCKSYDIDNDGDVDMSDLSAYQQ